MTAVVVTLSIVVAVLAVLVVGLLRSHAEILRRLHDLGADAEVDPAATAANGHRTPRPASPGPHPGPPRPTVTRPTVTRPTVIGGVSPAGDPVAVRTDHRSHDTVLLFLSSGCPTCEGFWEALADPARMHLPAGARPVVVTRDLAEERPAALAGLTPAGITVVASSDAWEAFGVKGSPYVVHTEAGTGRVRGEGTGGSWEQVARLLAEATGDLGYVGRRGGRRRARADVAREQRTDRALLTAGILPGDERLYHRDASADVPDGGA